MMEHIPVRHIETSQEETNLPEGFSIRKVQVLLDGKNMVQELHRHDFFYVLVLEKGAGHHAIDFEPCEVADRAVFCMRPGQVHALTLHAGSRGYLMQFNAAFGSAYEPAVQQALRRASRQNGYRLNTRAFDKLYAVLDRIFQEYTLQQEGFQAMIKANLSIFLIELDRGPHRERSLAGNRLYEQERLEEFEELLETHAARHKQVAYYAGIMNLSPYQLNAITKATLGKTCSEVISEYILLEARRYLLATSRQVNQIAYQLGYEDTSYFIRFFKKHTGQSPEAFRQNFT